MTKLPVEAVVVKRALFALLLSAAITAILSRPAVAQFGVSSASLSMGRAGLAPDPGAILVEEYFNFHKHRIAAPKRGESVGFEARWGADRFGSAGREAVLQIGLATRERPAEQDIPPLNVALVIDHSGSMSGDRIANVKKSILAFVERLRPIDRVAVVGFNHEANVILEAGPVENSRRIEQVIESIEAGGSTDIHAGLMLGYEQIAAGYDDEKTNRVILLTDGRTNSGVTDLEQIVTESLEFNKQGIDVSTIGLGNDLNHQLLRQLAKAGRGLIHFVDNAKDIRKIFIEELESLLSPVARNISVELEFDKNLECVQFFGYRPQYKKDRIVVRLDDLNHHSTQVLLVRFRLADGAKVKDAASLTARLNYRDIATGNEIVVERSLALPKKPKKEIDILQDGEVRKNLTIAELAQSIKLMAFAYEEEKYKAGKQHLVDALCAADKRYPECGDKDILRVRKIAQTYVKRMEERDEAEKKFAAEAARKKAQAKLKTRRE